LLGTARSARRLPSLDQLAELREVPHVAAISGRADVLDDSISLVAADPDDVGLIWIGHVPSIQVAGKVAVKRRQTWLRSRERSGAA
jgi:hypothetical protein